MNITVLGASGETGRLVVSQALQRGYQVVAYVRDRQSIEAQAGLLVIEGQLDNTLALAKAIRGADAVLICLGTRNKKPVDLMQKAIPQIVNLMEQENVSRLVLLSAYGVGETIHSAGFIARLLYRIWAASFYRDKQIAEEFLIRSKISWTCLYPVGLNNDPQTDAVEMRQVELVQKVVGFPFVPRANVAKVMLEVSGNDGYIRQKLIISSRNSLR